MCERGESRSLSTKVTWALECATRREALGRRRVIGAAIRWG